MEEHSELFVTKLGMVVGFIYILKIFFHCNLICEARMENPKLHFLR